MGRAFSLSKRKSQNFFKVERSQTWEPKYLNIREKLRFFIFFLAGELRSFKSE